MFRKLQSTIKKLTKISNNEYIKKLSYIDFSNIKDIIYDVKNRIHDVENEDLKELITVI